MQEQWKDLRCVEATRGFANTALCFSFDSYDEQKDHTWVLQAEIISVFVCSAFNNNTALGNNGNDDVLHVFPLTKLLGFHILAQAPTGII